MNLPTPTQLGMPHKFSQWRENQSQACESIAAGPTRFLVQACPTGFGKSITYMTAAMLTTGRTVVLTSTKGLQTQLIKDFGTMDGVVDIRGRGNYACRLNSKVNCDAGLCVFGMKCTMKEEGGCFYYDQVRKALRAKVVITNYSYWMSQNEYSTGLGDFDLMILDEAHSASSHVANHISVSFSKRSRLEKQALALDDSLPNNASTWIHWAEERYGEVGEDLEDAKLKRKEKKFIGLKRLSGKLERLKDRMDRTWVWEDNPYSVTLSPVWPAPYTETVLFMGTPRVVLTSATVVPKTADLLGIVESKREYEEYPSSFPISSRPLIHIPTVRMNWKIGEMEHRLWINKVDQIIRDRHGTKGIIHTVSYARRDMIMDRSKYSGDMVTHSSKDTEAVVRAFKQSDAPSILVSPSMATGWDFPDDECRWQVIVKLPYPDTRGNIIKMKSRQDKDFINYLVMQQLIQATGRGVRGKEDWCETFVIDNNITWFLENNKHLAVNWFNGAYKVNRTVPKPISKGEQL